MRLAWFTPWPPARSGIAAYSVEALGRFSGLPSEADLPWPSAIDVFVASPQPGRKVVATAASPATPVRPAHEFLPTHRRAPYDLVVYQLGNATCHDYMWPYLLNYPGLVVLHDGDLHHARARLLMASRRRDDYRTELAGAHPGTPADLAEFAIAGLEGSPYYIWPLRALPIDAARAVAVHNPRLAAELAEAHPATPIIHVPMGTREVAPARPTHVPRRVQGWLDAGDGPIFAAFGLVTPEKRVPQILEALAALETIAPRARLVLVGDTTGFYDVEADIARFGIADRVCATGWVDDADLDAWLALTDIALCLRWPTARETSASWLRALAAGRTTVITDLADLVDVPTIDPRSWTLQHAPRDAAAAASPHPWHCGVAVAIDILDELHSLQLAMRRLAYDRAMREVLGRNARTWWAEHHTLDRMAAGYQQAFATALAAPVDPPTRQRLPRHVRGDDGAHARTLIAPFGVQVDVLAPVTGRGE